MEKINKKTSAPGAGTEEKISQEVFIYIQECHRSIPGTNIGN